MIAAALLALASIALLAGGTPRQSALLLDRPVGPALRRMLRWAGLVMLAGSCALALTGPERARHLIGWIGLAGIEALAVAAAFAIRAGRRST